MISASDFTFDEYYWATQVSVADSRLAEGPVELVFAPEGRDGAPLTRRELDLISRAVQSLDELTPLAVAALYREYPALRAAYGYSDADLAQYMPPAESIDDMYALVSLSSISVHQIEREGVPYVGFAFDARWDVEHGAGVLMNGPRIVDTGYIDTSFLLWVAERDRDSGTD